MVFWTIVAVFTAGGLAVTRQGWVMRISGTIIGAAVGLVSALAYIQLV